MGFHMHDASGTNARSGDTLPFRFLRRLAKQALDAIDFASLRAKSRRDAAEIVRLRKELEAQARLIREQDAKLAHSRKIFQR